MYTPLHRDTLKNNSKTAVVTGAAQGIGAEIARTFVERGFSVALVDINEELGFEQERSLGSRAKFYRCDLSNKMEIHSLARSLCTNFETIDTVIHNAKSPAREKEIFENLDKEWDLSIQVMLKHPLLLTQLLFDSLKKSSNPSVLFIGSTNSRFISQQPLSYHVIKGALGHAIRYLACEYGLHKVRVNLLNPGIVDVPGRQRKNPQLFQQAVEAVIPLKRTALAREVADVCLFFSSEEAKYVTGTSFELDGGEHLKDHFHLVLSSIANEPSVKS